MASTPALKPPYANSRPAGLLALLSLLSPLAGLALEMALAWRYGAVGTVDAFRIASLLGGLGLALFHGFLLPHVVVPLFAQYRAEGREEEGWRLALGVALALSVVALPFVAWVWWWPETLAGLLGPGLPAAGQAEAAWLLRCFALAFLVMAWTGVASGILQAYRVFWPAALAQLLPNLALVLAVFAAGDGAGAGPLALGVLAGNAAMLVLLVQALLRVAHSARISLADVFRPASGRALRQALHLSLPMLAAILVGQWSSIVINRALSGLPPGTLAEFGYAWKLLMLASLLPAALATVVFPAFAEAHAGRDRAELSRLVSRAFRMTLLLTLPTAVFLLIEHDPLVALLFGGGRMEAEALARTGALFSILLLSAPAAALVAALGKVAYAMHDPLAPTVVAVLSAVAITLGVPHAAGTAGAAGVVWVFSLVSWGGALGLLAYQAFRHRLVVAGEAARYVALLALVTLAAAAPVVALRSASAVGTVRLGGALPELLLAGALFALAGLVLSRACRIAEAGELWTYAKWQAGQWLVRRA